MRILILTFILFTKIVPAFSQVNLSNGLVAYYPFNGNAQDESGNGNNGTVNGATLTTDRFGNTNAAYFFSSNDDINFGSGPSINSFTGNLSISVWIRPETTNTGSLNAVIAKWTVNQNTDHFGFWMSSSSEPVLGVGHPSYSHSGIYFSYAIPNETWTYITVIWEVGGSHKLYVNGQFEQEIINSNYGVISESTSALLKAGTDESNRYFDGKIDDIRIYDRSLNNAEILELFNFNLLPVELIEFNGKLKGKGINIFWQTASELNNLGFEVQKSRNGSDWEIIDFVEGQGTSYEINEYQYRDLNPFSGINYYRLKQIDFDEVFEYSKVISVEYNILERSIDIFPNPSNGLINIQIDNPLSQKMKIKILDNLGREVWVSEIIEEDSNWKKEIEITGKGLYFVTAQIGNEMYYKRVIITDEK